ncbi:MAG: hypothetical protein LBO79_10660 [Zoogloeaceae bacterium]|jgi:hypothetical protein|nr:hypothetical protein [Zoogloeaceae bacterium]
MSASVYQAIADALSRLKQHADAGEWEEAARVSGEVDLALGSARFPAARPEDRALIEGSLADIACVLERAGPLHADIGQLLAAFDNPATPPPS